MADDTPEITDAELAAEVSRLESEAAPAPGDGESQVSVGDEELAQEIENIETYGGRWGETALVSGAGALTLGAVPKLLEKAGVYEPGEVAQIQEYNPSAETVGEVGGIIGATLATGGTGLIGQAARLTTAGAIEAGGAVAQAALRHALKSSTNKLLSKEVVRKSAEMLGRGAVEGALFGASDLANEAAVGKADFNAENLLNYAGTGALFGGLGSAAIPVAGAGLKSLYSGGKALFDKSVSKFGNPTEDLLSLFGKSKKEIGEIMLDDSAYGQSYKEELLPWVKDRIGAQNVKSDEQLLRAMQQLNKSARDAADNIVEEVDSMLPNQPGLLARRKEVFSTLTKNVDDMIAYETKFGQDSELLRKLNGTRRKFIQRANEGAPIRTKDLREFRRVQDDVINYAKRQGDFSKIEKLARSNRTVLSDAMHDLAQVVSPAKAADLKQAMKDMHYSIDLIDSLGNKMAKGHGGILPNLTETVQAAGAVHLLGTPGGIIAAGMKFLNSDMKRRLNVITALKKANDVTEKETKSAISNFIASPKFSKKAQTASALTSSALALNADRERPKNKQEAYKNVSKNLNELMADPEKLLDKTAIATSVISKYAPDTAVAASSTLVRSVQFLQSKVPKTPYMDSIPGLKTKEYIPSSMEMAKFDRYMQIIEKPLTVLLELEQGTLTRDHVEALRVVYPSMYEFIRSTMINQMQDEGDIEMSYTKRIQTGILLDIVADSSMLANNIAALQANFKTQEPAESGAQPAVKTTQGGTENIKQAERTASDTQAFMQRRSQP